MGMIHLVANLEQRLTTTIDMLPDFILPLLRFPSRTWPAYTVGNVYRRMKSLSMNLKWIELEDFQNAVTAHRAFKQPCCRIAMHRMSGNLSSETRGKVTPNRVSRVGDPRGEKLETGIGQHALSSSVDCFDALFPR